MRAIYLQHCKNLPTNITGQIEELNNMVVEYAVPQIFGEANSYIKYKNSNEYASVYLLLNPFVRKYVRQNLTE